MHHMGGSQHLINPNQGASSGYGRKEIDDMVRPRSRSQSHFFKRENSLLLEVEQPHGIMILDGDGLMENNQRFQVIFLSMFHTFHYLHTLQTANEVQGAFY